MNSIPLPRFQFSTLPRVRHGSQGVANGGAFYFCGFSDTLTGGAIPNSFAVNGHNEVRLLWYSNRRTAPALRGSRES